MSQVHHVVHKLHQLRTQKWTREQRVFLGFVLFSVVAVGLILGVSFYKSSHVAMADMLPAKDTALFMEFEDFRLPAKMKDLPLSQESLEAFAAQALPLDLKAFGRWTDRRFGAALLEQNGASHWVFFLKSPGHFDTLSAFEKMQLPGEEIEKVSDKNSYYRFPQGENWLFGFAGPYVVISDDVGAVAAVQDTVKNQEGALSADPVFAATASNLPRLAWARGYVNTQKLTLVPEPVKNLIAPLKELGGDWAFALRKDASGFHFNTYLSLDPQQVDDQVGLNDPTPFAYKFTDYLPAENVAAYVGGANMTLEWQHTLETLSRVNPAYALILEGLIQAQVNKFFGSEVSLRDDFYPLFEGEYAVGLYQPDKAEPGVELILGHKDREFAEIKMKKMLAGFQLLAAQYAPIVHSVTLPDGTESKELMADESKVGEQTEDYKGHALSCIEVDASAYGFCYTVTDDLVLMANHSALLKATLDHLESSSGALSGYQPFRLGLSELSRVSDEITFLDIPRLSAMIGSASWGPVAQAVLAPFEGATWVKHEFEQGSSAEGVLLFR